MSGEKYRSYVSVSVVLYDPLDIFWIFWGEFFPVFFCGNALS
jgi:hypothetical protein